MIGKINDKTKTTKNKNENKSKGKSNNLKTKKTSTSSNSKNKTNSSKRTKESSDSVSNVDDVNVLSTPKIYPMTFSMENLRTYKNLATKKTKNKKFIKVPDSLYNINGLSDSAVLLYSIIKNQADMYKKYYSNSKLKEYRAKNLTLPQKELEKGYKELSNFLSNTPISNYPIVNSISDIQAFKNMSSRTINRAIQELEELGLMKVTCENKQLGREFTILEDVNEYITLSEIENLYRTCEELNEDIDWIKGLVYKIAYKDKEAFAAIVKKHNK